MILYDIFKAFFPELMEETEERWDEISGRGAVRTTAKSKPYKPYLRLVHDNTMDSSPQDR